MGETVGAVIRRARLDRGLSQSTLAALAYISPSHLSNVENGRYAVSAAVRAALGKALDLDLTPYAQRPAYPGAVSTSDDSALVIEHQPDGSVIIVPMDRRAFLATAAGAATAAAIALPDRITPDVLAALSDRLDWHVNAGRITHPDTMSRLLRADLGEITRAARQAPTAIRPALLSYCSRYAEYLGWMRQEAGDTTGALYWTDRAADFAHGADWRHMVAYTLARKSLILQHDHPDQAVDLAHAALTGPWRITPGLSALAATYEAEAHAHAGRPTEAYRALDVARYAAAEFDPNDEPPMGPRSRHLDDSLTAWTAYCAVYLGKPEQAINGLLTVIGRSTSARSRAIDRAHLASAYAQLGAVDEACAAAQAAAQEGKSSATARRELQAVRDALRPWAHRSDVADVLAALPA